MNLEIRNKNVLIIGASKGIGREISLAFAKEGAMVTAIARNEKLLVSLQHEMKQILCLRFDGYGFNSIG